MTFIETVIARCTRDGVVLWQHVAAQLGRSIDSVRAQFDPTYLRAYIAMPTRHREPVMEVIDETDLSSPYAKGPGLQVAILLILQRNSASIETLVNLTHSTRSSIGKRMWQLKQAGYAKTDGAYPSTWEITPAGVAYVTRRDVEGIKAA